MFFGPKETNQLDSSKYEIVLAKAFWQACEAGDIENVNLWLQFPSVQASVAAGSNYALNGAAKSGSIDVVKRLLEFEEVRDNVSENNNLTLISAAISGNLEIVNLLLEFEDVRENVAVNDNLALRRAALGGYLDIVNRLLAFEVVRDNVTASSNDRQDSDALSWAAQWNQPHVVERLLDFDAVKVALGYNPDIEKSAIMEELNKEYGFRINTVKSVTKR